MWMVLAENRRVFSHSHLHSADRRRPPRAAARPAPRRRAAMNETTSNEDHSVCDQYVHI